MYGQVIFFGGPLLALFVGAVYLAKSNADAPFWLRLFTSSYGLAIAAVFAVAVFAWPEQYRFRQASVNALLLMQLLPLALMAAALRWYPGDRRLHIVLVPVAVLAWLWCFALAYLAVHGE
ncbi:MAG: hypothetical protein U0132_24370 [Gemmatimonadaceae bacterium]